MELDELKSFINERMERVHAVKSPADIALLLGKKTQSVVGKIKTSLILEMIISAVFTLACIAVAIFGVYTSLRIYFAIFALVCLLFIPLLYLLFKKTNKLSSTALPVKGNLQALSLLIKEYVRRYFQLTMASIPISLLTAFLLGYTDESLYNPDSNTSFFSVLFESPLIISVIIVYILIFSVGMYYFTRWYLKKLYGNYLVQLEILIIELEEKQ